MTLYKFTNPDGEYILVEEKNTTKACLKLEARYILEFRLEFDEDMLPVNDNLEGTIGGI